MTRYRIFFYAANIALFFWLGWLSPWTVIPAALLAVLHCYEGVTFMDRT